MIYECEILTPWAVVDQVNMPLACAFHGIRSWEDVTGQDGSQIPPRPNLVVLKASVAQSLLSALASDPNIAILWSEPAGSLDYRRGHPTHEEMESLAAYIDVHAGPGSGWDIIGTDTHTLSRSTVAFRVKSWARRLRK